ncbi:MAG: VWA domain-containing protein [Cyanobacteria bacterium HKST-UBA02]|nr:VWA domain-containing protein [Cyanobacteria bacterium HKST-UBA02]
MKPRSIGTLAAVTFLLTTAAGVQLCAKESEPEDRPVSQKVVKRPRMDLAFCIDTTGSMQGEIDMVKEKVKELVAKLASGKPAPDIRVGMVAFRDKGDKYVTRAYQFTEDIDKFVADISSLSADGGGDSPEAVTEALKASVEELEWDDSKKTAKLLFLIGDAGPKSYGLSWQDESRAAIARGIQINTIGCDGLTSFPQTQGVDVFKEIARLADGRFEQLSYRQEVARADGSRSVIVKSGDRAYEVSSTAAGEWKKGAARLMAAGKASPLPAAPAMASRRAKMSAFAAPSGSYAAGAMLEGALAGGGAGAGASVDRRVNNLDSVLLDAALDKAESSLKVKYER